MAENYGAKDSLPFEVKVGLYMLTLGAASQNGIYSILTDVYGPSHANAIMDYVMFSAQQVRYHTTVQRVCAGSGPLFQGSPTVMPGTPICSDPL